MRMDNEEESRNIDDRRSSTGRSGGGMPSMQTMMILWPIVKPLLRSKFGLVIIGAGVAAYFMGYNPLSLLGIGGSASSAPQTKEQKIEDENRKVFITKVLKSTEDVWTEILADYKMHYTKPIMVLYRGYTKSGCGAAQSQMGPFYCPVDKKVYLDLGFFNELASRHNSPGDFAQAYVLAHEIGHHVQDLEGTLDKVQKMKQSWGGRDSRANALQVRVELQADCYAGVWGYYAQKKFHMLEPGDIEEALRAASSIGDDTLQKQAGQRVRPDGFTHGSSAQRVKWFKRGFTSGNVGQCDTFR